MFPAFSWGFDMHDILASRKSQSQGKTIFLCSINVTLKFLSSVTFQEHLQCAWPAPCNVPTLVLTNLNSSCLWVCLLSPSGLHCFCLLSFSAGVSFAPPPGDTKTFSHCCNWENCALLTCKRIDTSPAFECPTVHMVAFYDTERASSTRAEAKKPYTEIKRYGWFLPRPRRSLSPYTMPSRTLSDIRNVQ